MSKPPKFPSVVVPQSQARRSFALWIPVIQRVERGDEQSLADADFSATWRRNTVSQEEWAALREDLAREALAWRSRWKIRRMADHESTPGLQPSFICRTTLEQSAKSIDRFAARD